MPGIKELKTRIRSIGSTRKITRAMQMVSAAKMRKSQDAVLQSRSYSQMAWDIIQNVAKKGAFSDPLIRVYPDAKKIGIILLATNRGFVGSLNTNLIEKIKELDPSAPADAFAQDDNSANQELICEIVTYGKKGQIVAARMNKNIAADFPKADRLINTEDIYPLAQFVAEKYSGGQYRKIVIVYNHFVSTISQKSTIKQILPFIQEPDMAPSLSEVRLQPAEWVGEGGQRPGKAANADESEYLFEPSPRDVIEHLIPRIVESQIYQAILESDASEHSARMVMMKNATEAAGDLIGDLTLAYNQLRQNKITTELAEITAGKIALE